LYGVVYTQNNENAEKHSKARPKTRQQKGETFTTTLHTDDETPLLRSVTWV
jgi:hypothetical protein